VLGHRLRRRLAVVARHGGDDRGVPPGGRLAQRLERPGVECVERGGAGVPDRLLEHAVAARVGDREVERRIGAAERAHVGAAQQRGLAAVELTQVRRAVAPGGEPRRHRLDRQPIVEDLGDLRPRAPQLIDSRARHGDDRAAAASALRDDQALALQDAQRLANGGARHTHGVGESALGRQLLAREDHAERDRAAQPVEHRRVRGRDMHRAQQVVGGGHRPLILNA
jgi:hypothetical protein